MSYYWLMLKRNEDEASFDAEYQNMPVDPRTALFRIEELCYWSDRFPSQDVLLYALGRDKQFYGACDPSIGKQRQKGDYSAIISGVCSSKGIIYILDADVERRNPDKTINDILLYCQKYRFEKFGFEKNGFQEFMRSELERRGAEARVYPPLFPIVSSRDKKGRIESLQPMIKKGLIRFSTKHKMLLEQMKYYPKGHDDSLDALHMLVETIKASRYGGPKIHVIRL
jgi:predicted phage terminase large subunit-like protein